VLAYQKYLPTKKALKKILIKMDHKSGSRVEHFLNAEEKLLSSKCAGKEDRSLEENCGVFGIIGKANASRAAFFALYALNHR
jgi:hypothetical protein